MVIRENGEGPAGPVPGRGTPDGGRLGVAFGGGGMRGMAHFGVLRTLYREGIVPYAVSGTSAGSMVAALWAAGWHPEEMIHLALRLRPRDLLDYVISVRAIVYAALDLTSLGSPPADLPKGFIRGARIQQRFHEWTGGLTLDEVKKPIAIIATDLDDGTPVVFTPPPFRESVEAAMPMARCETEAPLAVAVRASCAIPGLFEPVIWEGRTLVDGAVTDRVPVRPLKGLEPDITAAVDVCTGELPRRGFWDVFAQVNELMAREISRHHMDKYADIVINPPVNGVRLTQFGFAPAFIRLGSATCRRAVGDIRERLAAGSRSEGDSGSPAVGPVPAAGRALPSAPAADGKPPSASAPVHPGAVPAGGTPGAGSSRRSRPVPAGQTPPL